MFLTKMESHPLNQAHQQHRRAEAHLMSNRYDEALECHHSAAELLLDAMKSTTSSVALESMTLQHSYHLKQKDMIRSKKEQYDRVKKSMDNIKVLGKGVENINLQVQDYNKLQVAIYKTINENDSLLNMLINKNSEKEMPTVNKDIIDGKRTEKSKEIVVEELQILNQDLHSLVDQLVIQVEVLKDENTTLKERVNYLEKERVKFLNIQNPYNAIPRNFDIDTPVVANVRMPSQPVNEMAKERPTQPHFDLSALKDN